MVIVTAMGQSNDRTVSGSVRVGVEGQRGGRTARLDLREVAVDRVAQLSYQFQYFENIEQELTPPPGFTPERVTVQVKPLGGKGDGVIQSILWPAVGS